MRTTSSARKPSPYNTFKTGSWNPNPNPSPCTCTPTAHGLLHISACTCVHVHGFDRAPTEFRFLSLKAQVASSPGPSTGTCYQTSPTEKSWSEDDRVYVWLIDVAEVNQVWLYTSGAYELPKGRPSGTYIRSCLHYSIASINKLEACDIAFKALGY